MIFVKTFKGYEDKTSDLDAAANEWISKNKVDVRGIEVSLSHEANARSRSGDLLFTILYKADQPVP